jgi:surface polysaccharide O-acyltransferase-like enzyme
VLDSLSANAYTMYLVHYVFVVWLQYALLGSDLPAISKAAVVFTGTFVLSWGASVGLSKLLSGSFAIREKRPIWTVSR